MKWLPDYFNDIGVLIAIVGFAVTIWQILLLQSRSKAIQLATTTAVNRLETVDHAIRISKSREVINRLKATTKVHDFPSLDRQIQDLKEDLIFCTAICPEVEPLISEAIEALDEVTNQINEVLISPSYATRFNYEPLYFTLDKVRGVFALAIVKTKK